MHRSGMSLWIFLRRNKQSSLDKRQPRLLLTKKWTGEIPMTRVSSLREVKCRSARKFQIYINCHATAVSNWLNWIKCLMFETKPYHCRAAWQALLCDDAIDIEKWVSWRLVRHTILQATHVPGDTLLIKTLHSSSVTWIAVVRLSETIQ